jgi:hypothetical protein
MEVGGQLHALATLSHGKRPSTNCTGHWVGPRAGLDRCGKSHPHQDSIPRPFNPYTDDTIPDHNNSILLCIIITSKDSSTKVAQFSKKDYYMNFTGLVTTVYYLCYETKLCEFAWLSYVTLKN